MRALTIMAGVLLGAGILSAHCEIPCGIYDDETRFHMLEEHITTMEKSIDMINQLNDKTDALSRNQLTRWVMNKEKHATEFQNILWQYFLTQRIKPVTRKNPKKYRSYHELLELVHLMTFHAMKVKQTVDYDYTKELRKLLNKFEKLYKDTYGHKH